MESFNVVSIVTWAINVVRAYAIAGLVFAIPFVLFWAKRVDHAARGSSWGFRIIIIPGVAALWPMLAIRLLRGKTKPIERTAHRDIAAKYHPEAHPEAHPVQGG